MYKIQIFNCICVLYFVYFKYLGRDEVGIQRYNGRGKTGLGKWENGRRYLGRNEIGHSEV
jgi:NADH:ubiquinone oxidoreductase subunit